MYPWNESSQCKPQKMLYLFQYITNKLQCIKLTIIPAKNFTLLQKKGENALESDLFLWGIVVTIIFGFTMVDFYD